MLNLIAFLGNPGSEYKNNRHNAGRLFAERLNASGVFDLEFQKKFKGLYCAGQGEFSGYRKIHFLEPETYMNLSGESVASCASFFKIPPEEILVVHDELEIPPGTAGFKFSGGLGGHNGLRSLRACLGTADFWRLRIGIGRPLGKDVAGYVLQDFSAAEMEVFQKVADIFGPPLLEALKNGTEGLLPEWGKKVVL
jgi:PTH1 family peptidyl-tRNA hydrolase